MINIQFQNDNGMIFNPEDWIVLRKTHRIIGTTIGCLPSLPRQTVYQGLPMILLPEQVILLVLKEIAQLVCQRNLYNAPSEKQQQNFKERLEQSCEEQRKIQFSNKKASLLHYAKNFNEGRRKRKDRAANTSSTCQEEINETEEIEQKLKELAHETQLSITEDKMRLSTELQYHDDSDQYEQINLNAIWVKTSKLRYKVFEALWNRQYFITDGVTFGGDFLVYLGDPIEYHASFIVKCVEEPSKTMSTKELICASRLANNVKKITVFASFKDNSDSEIDFIHLEWISNNNFNLVNKNL